MKTRELSRKHVEHLVNIGFKTKEDIETLLDAPYILFKENTFYSCYSSSEFNSFSGEIKTNEQILKLRPLKEKDDVKKLSKKEQLLHKLLYKLNLKKNCNITGYDVSWAIQESKRDKGRYEILPISPHACGSISMEHLEIILNFAKENTHIYPTLSYTNYNGEKERYGTSTPCIYFY